MLPGRERQARRLAEPTDWEPAERSMSCRKRYREQQESAQPQALHWQTAQCRKRGIGVESKGLRSDAGKIDASTGESNAAGMRQHTRITLGYQSDGYFLHLGRRQHARRKAVC